MRRIEMQRKLGLWLVWIGFIAYVLLFAPPLPPDMLEPVRSLLSGQIPALNPVNML